VIGTLGRRDLLESSDDLEGLAASLGKFMRHAAVLADHRSGKTEVLSAASLGPALVFGRLWDQLGLPAVLADDIAQQIKNADRGAAYLEATLLAGFRETEAKRLFGRDPGLSAGVRDDYLTPWSAAKAEKRFLARFNTLTD
jgi:hypothetical protein